MNEVSVTGNNATVVIDDKDTYNKTVNKTVNEKTVNKTVIKADTAQLELDVKTIQDDVAKLLKATTRHTTAIDRIEKKLDALTAKLSALPVAETQKEVEE